MEIAANWQQVGATGAAAFIGLLLIVGFTLTSSLGCSKEANQREAKPLASKASSPEGKTGGKTGGSEIDCQRQPSKRSIDLAEASGATWMPDGTVLVIGDSDTNGAFVLIDSTDGRLLRRGALPLDGGASDDLEGLSRIGERVYALTSSGYMREWIAKDGVFTLVAKSYPIGAEHSNLLCRSPQDSNCAANFEGLCLRRSPPADAHCVGYAASKALGVLICLGQRPGGHLFLRPEQQLRVASPKTLSGCSFSDDDTLFFGNNLFAANAVGFVTGHDSPASAVIHKLGALGLGFSEAIALGPDGQLFRFSDTATAPSLLDKYICR